MSVPVLSKHIKLILPTMLILGGDMQNILFLFRRAIALSIEVDKQAGSAGGTIIVTTSAALRKITLKGYPFFQKLYIQNRVYIPETINKTVIYLKESLLNSKLNYLLNRIDLINSPFFERKPVCVARALALELVLTLLDCKHLVPAYNVYYLSSLEL